MIYVFKTSVKSRKDVKRLKPHLKKLLGDSPWNFDLEDCDNILRVDSEEESIMGVIALLRDSNFDCEELVD